MWRWMFPKIAAWFESPLWARGRQPWLAAVVLAAAVPLFPEYVAIFLALGSFACAVWDAKKTGAPSPLHRARSGMGLWLTVYIGYMALGLVYTQTPGDTFNTTLLWMVMFGLYLSLSSVLTDAYRVETALFCLAVIGGLVGAIGCAQYAWTMASGVQHQQLWLWMDKAIYRVLPWEVNLGLAPGRMCATFSNPNILAEYLVMTMPLLIGYSFDRRRSRRARIMCRICLLTTVGGITFTYSRGAYLALLVICLVFFVANLRKIFAFIISAMAAFLLVPTSVLERLLSIRGVTGGGAADVSISERMGVMDIALGTVAQNPVFGNGAGVQYFWGVLRSQGINAPHAHNLVLQLLIEGGMVGLGLMLVICYQLLAGSVRLLVRPREEHAETVGAHGMGIAFFAFAAGFMTMSMTEHTLFSPKLIGTFLTVLALSDAVVRLCAGRAVSPVRSILGLGQQPLRLRPVNWRGWAFWRRK